MEIKGYFYFDCVIYNKQNIFVSAFKGAQALDIRDRVIYTERSHLGW
jgi:hypothetical protein